MVTRRSLTKLERKAHMSLHDTVELADETEASQGFSRDRFGKKQAVPEDEEKQ